MRTFRALSPALAVLAAVMLGAPPAFAELKVTIGGYIKLDGEYQDTINTAAANSSPNVRTVPFGEGPNKDRARSRNGQFNMDARETRFNITAADAVGGVKLKGFIEVDFNGTPGNSVVSNSNTIRVRHAYGEGAMKYGPGEFKLLAGQSWSAFGTQEGGLNQPQTIDFSSQNRLFSRQPQFKVTYGLPFGKDTLNLIGAVQAQGYSFALAAAGLNSVAGAMGNAVVADNQEGQDVPAFVAKIQWQGSLIKAELAGIGSSVRGIAGNGSTDSTFAYGLQGTVIARLGKLGIHLHADTLNGINGQSNGSFPDAVLKPGPRGTEVATINTVGFWGGLSYRLTPTTRLNGLYGQRAADSSGHSGFGRRLNGFQDLVREQTLHVNALQQFWERFQFGVEYERLWIEAFQVNSGSTNIYHAAFWYFF